MVVSVQQYLQLIVPEHNSGQLITPLAPALAKSRASEAPDTVMGNLFQGMALTTITATEAPDRVTANAGAGSLIKIWENTATGFHFGGVNNVSFTSGFAGGNSHGTRIVGNAFRSCDGNDYQLSLATGATQTTGPANTFQLDITANFGSGTRFIDASGHPTALVMPHSVAGTVGVYTNSLGDSAAGNIKLTPQGSGNRGTNANLLVCDELTGTVLGDVIAVLSKPTTITGTWRMVGTMPAADWQHVGVMTKDSDSGGTGAFWMHVVSITSGGSCAEVARYNFTSTTDAAVSIGIVGSWVDAVFTSTSNAMLESGLNAFWTVGPGGAPIRATRFQLNSSSQFARTGLLDYSANIGVGYSSIYADAGQLTLMTDNFAHSLIAT